MFNYFFIELVLPNNWSAEVTFPGLNAASEWTTARPSNPSILKQEKLGRFLSQNIYIALLKLSSFDKSFLSVTKQFKTRIQ